MSWRRIRIWEREEKRWIIAQEARKANNCLPSIQPTIQHACWVWGTEGSLGSQGPLLDVDDEMSSVDIQGLAVP